MTKLNFYSKITETNITVEVPHEYKRVYKFVLNSIYQLEPKSSVLILFYLLANSNHNNKVVYSVNLMKEIAHDYHKATGLSRSVSNLCKQFHILVSKGFLVQGDFESLYYLNPMFFHEGTLDARDEDIMQLLVDKPSFHKLLPPADMPGMPDRPKKKRLKQ